MLGEQSFEAFQAFQHFKQMIDNLACVISSTPVAFLRKVVAFMPPLQDANRKNTIRFVWIRAKDTSCVIM